MIAIVLAGECGTRLRDLSNDLPKPLLKVADKPIVDYIFDKLTELEGIQHVTISTNSRFGQQFREWLNSNPERKAEIIEDKSLSEEKKPGAIVWLAQTASRISDDCLIIAGDNLFTCSLKPMIRTYGEIVCSSRLIQR